LKYVNLLEHGEDQFDLSQTTLNLGLGKFELRRGGSTLVRAEIERNGCKSVVDIMSGAKTPVSPGNPERNGVLVSVDVIQDKTGGHAVSVLPELLELLHMTEKEIFFGLLTETTLEKLGPSYQNIH
jgi:uncharacterized protein (TIGR04255 family)